MIFAADNGYGRGLATRAASDENAGSRCAKERMTVSTEAPKGPNIRELESLRIARAANPKKPSRIIPAVISDRDSGDRRRCRFRRLSEDPWTSARGADCYRQRQAGRTGGHGAYRQRIYRHRPQVYRDRHQDSRADCRRSRSRKASGSKPATCSRESTIATTRRN